MHVNQVIPRLRALLRTTGRHTGIYGVNAEAGKVIEEQDLTRAVNILEQVRDNSGSVHGYTYDEIKDSFQFACDILGIPSVEF